MTLIKVIKFLILFMLGATMAYAQHKAVYTEKTGTGPVVIFLPGFTTPGDIWEENILRLDEEYTTITVSYAGFNGLPAIDMPWYETIVSELKTYIEEENIAHFSLVGHSMGGMLAMELAAEFPERIDKLIIVDALPCMRALMMPGVPADAIQYESPYNQQMLQQGDSAIAATAHMMAQNMTMNTEWIPKIAQWGIDADRETYVYGYTDLLKVDLRPALEKITAETIIIGATFPDRDLIMKNFQDQYANLSVKSIVLAPESRHFVMLDQPEWFQKQLNSFLAK
jgi:pimeloyl-ACP methyl ester carboxylesterase